jgi:cysteine-rich repeat protein
VATARSGATSEQTSCVLDETGIGKCWGGNVAGSTTDRAAPAELLPLSGVRAIHAGLRHQCRRLASNYVHCIGGNDEGQLGNGTRGASSTTTVQVLGLPAPVSGPDPMCGDGFLTPGETCDDGQETARCNANCTLSMCGDGILNVSDGEACETDNDLDAGSCLPDCTLP